jgi:hypothetical protein
MSTSIKITSQVLDKIRQLSTESKPTYDGSWLGRDPSKAFLICLGAGPWKEQRRYEVQKYAIDWYWKFRRYSDLSEINLHEFTGIYPFDWQDNHLWSVVDYLQRTDPTTFSELCSRWREPFSYDEALQHLFQVACVRPKGTKVLWMFARDFLKIPAFPIDRWVARKLTEYGLPKDPWVMTEACLMAGVSPNELNRSFFPAKNPDWSHL